MAAAPRSRRSTLPWLALALAAAFALWWTRPSAEAPARSVPEQAPEEPASEDLPIATSTLPEPAAPPAPAPAATREAPSTPPSTTGSHDPCADAEGDPVVERPSIDDMLQLRIAELNDRMRLVQPGTALREGLDGALGASGTGLSAALETLSRAPDRVQDGFDNYVAVLVVLAARALAARDVGAAVRLATTATRADPSDPLSHVVLAIAFERRGDFDAATDAFRQAFALEPDEPALAFALATRLRDGADPATAVTAFDRYLAAVPEDAASARTRARLALRVAAIASPIVSARAGVTLVAPAALDPVVRERALSTVVDALAAGARLLGVPRRDSLTVFVYPDRDAMRRATCAQGWTGAMFDGALHTDVETLSHPRESTVMLRHESLHAAIHPRVPDVPTWLDEGLAQYLAEEEGRPHFASYALMVREHTWVPFGTMNDAFLVIDDGRDAGLAYHQALAMVLWLVDRRGERGIADAIAWLSSGGDPTRVLDEAGRGTLDGEGLLTFLRARLAAAPPR